MMKPGPSLLRGSLRTSYVARRNAVTNEMPYGDTMRWDQAKPYFQIPKVPTVPILGSGWQYLPIVGIYDFHKRHEANRMKIKKYGRIFRERFNSTEYVICTTIEDLKTIVQSEGPSPIAMELTSVKAYRESNQDAYTTKGLLCLNGEEWQRLRKSTQKYILKPSIIDRYIKQVQYVAQDFVKLIGEVKDVNNEVPDLLQEIYRWSLECVCLIGLDRRLGCLEPDLAPHAAKVIETAITLFEMKTKLETFTGSVTFWKKFKTPTWKKFEKASEIYTDITFNYVTQTLMDLERYPLNFSMMDMDLTLVQSMIYNGDLSLSDAIVFVSDLLLAGMDTTSYTAGFFLYNLAMHPNKQELVYQEVMKLLPRHGNSFTPEILEDCKYLKACWKESMRLTPIVPARGRILSEDVVLSGYQVPAGTYVGLIYDPIYMDKEIFESPTSFIPERWLDRSQKYPKYAFQPFGFGFRNCIGKRFAEIQLVTLIAEIVRKYKIDYKYESIGICSKLLNVPDKPLRFTFIERSDNNR